MDVTLSGAGANSNIETQVDPTFQAARTSSRPLEYQSQGGVIGGHYSVGAQSGTISAGIASLAEVFHVRWADPSKLFILKKFVVQCSTGTGFAATTLGAPLELIIGHGSTANGSGGTAIAPTSISNRMRQTMASTAFATSGRLAIATTLGMTAATGQTLEAAAIGECMGADNRTLVSTPPMPLFEQRDLGTHPLVLNSGDSLVMRTLNPAGTGTWFFCVTMEWVESVSY